MIKMLFGSEDKMLEVFGLVDNAEDIDTAKRDRGGDFFQYLFDKMEDVAPYTEGEKWFMEKVGINEREMAQRYGWDAGNPNHCKNFRIMMRGVIKKQKSRMGGQPHASIFDCEGYPDEVQQFIEIAWGGERKFFCKLEG